METADTHHFNPNFLRKITHDALRSERILETADTHNASQTGRIEFDDRFLRGPGTAPFVVGEKQKEQDEDLVTLGDHQRRIIELDIREHYRKLKTDMQTADQHNQAHTGRLEFEDKFLRKTPQSRNLYEGGELPASEDLVSEHDYQRRIEELELTVAVLRGRIWRAEEERDQLRERLARINDRLHIIDSII